MSEIFGENKELRFLGWCANYVMETNSDSVIFRFRNYLVHRNLCILLLIVIFVKPFKIFLRFILKIKNDISKS